MSKIDRRTLLQLMGAGGVMFASRLFPSLAAGCAGADSQSPFEASRTVAPLEDFMFMQLSDTHWGFAGDAVNPNAKLELGRTVDAINGAATQPDFIVFTGDLTHTTDDPDERRKRMSEFKDIVSGLNVKDVRFMPGEHDAAPDAGAAFKEFFGDLNYTFDHKGIHFIVLDNCSDPMAQLGDKQLQWLADDLKKQANEQPIVVLTHRPLWDLKPEWDWTTADGAKAIDLLMPYPNVVVFFGHIHQELHHETGHIQHHAARSLMFALPTPDTQGMRNPVPWDADHPEAGLGYRQIDTQATPNDYDLTELPLMAAKDAP